MPYRNQYQLDKSKMAWMQDAARAILARTTPGARYSMLRQGFIAFERHARVSYKELAGFNFTSGELRWIWDYLEQAVCVRPRVWSQGRWVEGPSERDRCWDHLRKVYEADLHRSSAGLPHGYHDDQRIILTDADIVSENASGRIH